MPKLDDDLIEDCFEAAYTYAAKRLGQLLILEGVDLWDGLTQVERDGFKAAVLAIARVAGWPQ